ncbi:MAG TPA: metallophosphoesterase [Candidatus Wunengus sp. YC63]|uniref:metallophosphoesterase n=1 Tax=unclassified Candidatus Wunengus TaxID=3367695 RepID=UPI00402A4F7A
MKIISFGDVHEDTNNLIKIKSELENADLIVISGDLTNYHGKVEAKKVLESIEKYNKHLLAQYGNLDQPEVNEYLTGEGVNLHGNGYVFGDVGIFGCGGSSPTPFNTPSEITESDIKNYLTHGYSKVKDAKWKIMVCHTPPKDTAIDIVRSGIHVGSGIVRDFIVQHKPDVCISGHIHESRGKDKVGDTIVLNAGMFRDGWYIEINIDKEGLSAMLKALD